MVRTLAFAWLAALCTVFAYATPTVQPTTAPAPDQADPGPTEHPALPPVGESAPRQAYGGTLVCHADYISSDNPNWYMTRDEAASAISTFCGRISNGVVFKQSGGTPLQTLQVDGPYGYPMAVSAVWSPMGRTDCPTTDFNTGGNGTAICTQSLLRNIIDACNPSQDGKQFWKGGGRFSQNCIGWEIRRAASLDPMSSTNSTSTIQGSEGELR